MNATFPKQAAHPNGIHNQNVASDGAFVNQQNAANYGDTTFHYGDTYHVNQGDPPQRKFDVALNFLAGGMPRGAESLLDELVRGGHHSTKLAYYYALASLGDRSLNDIDKGVHDKFVTACKIAEEFGPDEWRAALDAMRQFVTAMWQEPPDVDTVQGTIAGLEALPSPRRDEITRHLRMIIDGAAQDSLDGTGERIATERLQGNRAGRAWKFFEPRPAPPRKFEHPRTRSADDTAWIQVGGGALGLLIGVGLLIGGIVEAPITAVSIPLLAIGGYMVLRFGTQQARQAAWRQRKDLEHGYSYVPKQPTDLWRWGSAKFIQEIQQRVDARFREVERRDRGSWETASRGVQEHLKYRLIVLYGGIQTPAAAVDWLIRWHAQQAHAKWRAGTLFAYRSQSASQNQTDTTRLWAGCAIAVLGLFFLLAGGSVVAALFIGVGGYFARTGAAAITFAPWIDAQLRAENEQLFADEQRAYEAWNRELIDRPTDAEMARWLDLDKAYLKIRALKRYGWTSRDLAAHVVMTERYRRATRAKVSHGPPRYSAYVVFVFLLTRHGVREIEFDLDFLTGAVWEERRISFQYDALASARVAEASTRTTNTGRNPEQDQNVAADIASVRRLEFRLTLVNQEAIKVVPENFREPTDTNTEGDTQLMATALQSSGIASALHVLEAVAAEGHDWISREEERRRRASRDWLDVM
jgi:hypothetical protein